MMDHEPHFLKLHRAPGAAASSGSLGLGSEVPSLLAVRESVEGARVAREEQGPRCSGQGRAGPGRMAQQAPEGPAGGTGARHQRPDWTRARMD